MSQGAVREGRPMNDNIRATLLNSEAGAPVLSALDKLITDDAYLLRYNANERAIVHRFAMYLQTHLPAFHVDCEYNRDGVDPKRLRHIDLYPDSEDTEAKTVFPDVVAHVRGTDNNYLIIEMKKSTNPAPRSDDIAKLRGYKRQLDYRFALFLELKVGADDCGVLRAEWIEA
jgi:hypothetical protein